MKNLFQDDDGNISLMRALSAFVIVTVILVWGYLSISNSTVEDVPGGLSTCIVAAFGGKAIQKFAEKEKKKKRPQPLNEGE